MTTAQAERILLDVSARLKEATHRRRAQILVDTVDLAWLVSAASRATLDAAPGDRVVTISRRFEEEGIPMGTEGTVRGYDLATHRVQFDGVDWSTRVSAGQVDVLPKEPIP